ncbi:hypothetical protein DL546_009517 [Coniochaeta pulveracea]|uniref:LysM domain-containing protein n=1 Tax=Coniochaeta pulveracea TaxID=177199 RepID=A0A420YKJ7_9PEZI|nr:hypothetical protein DL546_009517 [Coniochaeta pulveracea]
MKQSTLALLMALVTGFDVTNCLTQAPWPPSAPTQALFSSQCAGWDVAVLSDDCYQLAIKYNLTLDEFIHRNPQLQAACNTNLWAGYAFCILAGTSSPSFMPPPDTASIQSHQSSVPSMTSSDPSPPYPSLPAPSANSVSSPSIVISKTTYTLLSKETYISSVRVPGPTVTCTIPGPTMVSIIKTGSGTLVISAGYAATTTVPVSANASVAPAVTVDVTVTSHAKAGPALRVTLRDVEHVKPEKRDRA